MIPHKIEPRRRYQGRKLPYQVNGMEDNMRCSIAPSMPQTVQHTAGRKPRQAFYGHCRTRHISAEILEADAEPSRECIHLHAVCATEEQQSIRNAALLQK